MNKPCSVKKDHSSGSMFQKDSDVATRLKMLIDYNELSSEQSPLSNLFSKFQNISCAILTKS